RQAIFQVGSVADGHAVEQPPVGPERRLRSRDQGVGVGALEVSLDQRAALGRVVDVGLLVEAEVLVARAVADPVVGCESLALGPRDRRLAALDRVEADELGEAVAARGPGLDALARLGGRRGRRVAPDRVDEAIPEPDVLLLLGGVTAQRGAL